MNERGFTRERLEKTREDFARAFLKAVEEASLPVLPAWFALPSSNDDGEANVASWIAADGKRALIVEERNPDEPVPIDWFFKRWGDEIDMLQISIRAAEAHVSLVVDCYRQWLLDNATPDSLTLGLTRAPEA